MKLDINLSVDQDLAKILTDLTGALNQLVTQQDTNQENIMADLSELKTEIEGLSDVGEAVTRVLDALVQKIQESGVSQEEIDALVDEIQAHKQELADAIRNIASQVGGPQPDNTLPGDLPGGGGDRR